MKSYRTIKILTIISFLWLLLEIFVHFNILDLEKYEVKEAEFYVQFNGGSLPNKVIESKKKEISKWKSENKIRLTVSPILFISLFIVMIYKKEKLKSNKK